MLFDIVEAKYIDGYNLRISFEDGKQGVFDFSPYVKEGIFIQLRDKKEFIKFYVNKELGTICWPNGADIAPETIYEKLKT